MLAEKLREKRRPAGEMIEEKLPAHSDRHTQNRKKLLCKYAAILLSHEMLWEAALFTEVPETLDFYHKLLELIEGQELETVAFPKPQIEHLDSLSAERLLRLNEQFQNHIAISIVQVDPDEEQDDSHRWLELQVELLDFFVKSNARHRRVDPLVFVNDTCSEQLDIPSLAKVYYYSKKKPEAAQGKFVFLEFPWLFSTAAKVDVIQIESKLAMQGIYSDMYNPAQDLEMALGLLSESPVLSIQVRRHNILDDSLRALSTQSKNYKKQMRVKFAGEEGVDQGGVKKEFFHLLMKELFNPNYAMFEQKLGVSSRQAGPLPLVQQALARGRRKLRAHRLAPRARDLQLGAAPGALPESDLQKTAQGAGLSRGAPR